MHHPTHPRTPRLGSAIVIAVALAGATLTGCASIRTAQPKTVDIDGKSYVFGGTYDPSGNALTVTVNGDPALRGSFPPYTPTLHLSAKAGSADIAAQCYFGSVLGGRASRVGIIAGAIQGGLGKSSDKCDMTVNGKTAQELFF